MKRTIALLVIALALAAVVAATRARRFGLRVESFAVTPGASADNAPKLGDDLPFAPFRFAVIHGPIKGDHAALGRAMDGIRERGGADFVVLMGDVLGDGGDAECRKLAAACRDRGMEVVAIPGLADLAATHVDAFRTWMNGERWWFVHRHVWFYGAQTDGKTDDLIRSAGPPSIEDRLVGMSVVAEPHTDWPVRDWVNASWSSDKSSVLVRLYSVSHERRVDGAPHDFVDSSPVAFDVPRSATLASLWRTVALDVLFPVVRSTAGYAAFLAACAIVAAFALTRLRPARAGPAPG